MTQAQTARPFGLLAGLLAVLFLCQPMARAAAPDVQACNNVVVNGGFETVGAWMLGSDPIPPQYVNNPVVSGNWAMQLGNRGQASNVQSYSSVRQTITIPATATNAEMSFWVWTQSEPDAGDDRQELLLLGPGASRSSMPVARLWEERSNVPSWRQLRFSLNALRGQSFDLYFNVYNDGLGGRTAMVIDDVAVTVCQNGGPPTPTPTPTLTPTATAVPGANVTFVGNLTPNGFNPQTINQSSSLFITVDVYAAGVTDGPGQGAGISCALRSGRVPAFGGVWSDIADRAMAYVGDAGINDRYGVALGPLAPGLYEYTAWCRGSANPNPVWADNSATGGHGKLTVTATAATATPTATPTVSAGVTIGFVGNLQPNGNAPQTITTQGVLGVSVDVFAPGVTDAAGRGAGINCGLQYGPVPFLGGPPSAVYELPMAYAGDAGALDRYAINFGPLPAGLYSYNAWCSGNGGLTKVLADPTLAGRLTVTAAPGTVTPVPPTAPPVTPPAPSNCRDIIVNGGFEGNGGWFLGPTALMPFYAGPPSPVHAGSRSLAMGATLPSSPNVAAYSSAQQDVTVAGWAQTATIRFWYYPISNAAPNGLSRQELILLDPLRQFETVDVLWRVTQNDNTWKVAEFDLTRFRGRTLSIYFNARNAGDGTRTAMYLDDVALNLCSSQPMMPMPLPMPLPAASIPALPGQGSQQQTQGVIIGAQVPAQVIPAGPTVIQVGTPNPLTTAAPSTVWQDTTPRRQRGPLFGDWRVTDNPLLLVAIIGVLALLAVLFATWLFTREDRST